MVPDRRINAPQTDIAAKRTPCDAERPFLFQDTGRTSTIVGAGDWEWT
jgi:hypothetical protein